MKYVERDITLTDMKGRRQFNIGGTSATDIYRLSAECFGGFK